MKKLFLSLFLFFFISNLQLSLVYSQPRSGSFEDRIRSLENRIERLETDLGLEEDGRHERGRRINLGQRELQDLDKRLKRLLSTDRSNLSREVNRKLNWEIEQSKNRVYEIRDKIQSDKDWIDESHDRSRRMSIDLDRAIKELDDEVARKNLVKRFKRLEEINDERRKELGLEDSTSESDNLYPRTELEVPETALPSALVRKWRAFQAHERKYLYNLCEMNRFKRQNSSEEGHYDGKMPAMRALKIFDEIALEYEKNSKKSRELRKDIFKEIDKMDLSEVDNTSSKSENFSVWLKKNGRDVMVARFVSINGDRVDLENLGQAVRRYPLADFWIEEQKAFHALENAEP